MWQRWIAIMAGAEGLAAVGLWRLGRWGTAVFLVVAFSQLLVYGTAVALFGLAAHLGEAAVIGFHVVSVAGFIGLRRSGHAADDALA